jgi:hypothetical protein
LYKDIYEYKKESKIIPNGPIILKSVNTTDASSVNWRSNIHKMLMCNAKQIKSHFVSLTNENERSYGKVFIFYCASQIQVK